jgi:branched-chain amino acid aminotransferase
MGISWFNGRLIDGPISLDPTDRGLTLGDGIFETLAVFNRRPAYLAPHLDRLGEGAEAFGIAISRAKIESGVGELCRAQPHEHGILRITVTRGPGTRGLAGSGDAPTVLMTLAAWQRRTINAPVRLATSTVIRNERSPTTRLKTLSYAENILAAREAAAKGADDALLLNSLGRVACTTISNIFIIRGAKLLTPPLSHGALPGIIRSRVMMLAASVGLDAQETEIHPRDLYSRPLATSDMIFLTNSIRLIRPVTVFDEVPVPQNATAQVGSLLAALCEEIARDTGRDPRNADRADP